MISLTRNLQSPSLAPKKRKKGAYEIKMPKSISSIRTVSIDNTLNQYLLEYKSKVEKEKDFSPNMFMFGGVRPYPESCVSQRKNSAIRRSGVKKIRIHDFRHSHASILINNGMNIIAVSKRLGHSDINITLKVYAHLLEEKNEEITVFLEKSSHKSSQNDSENSVDIKKSPISSKK